MGLLSQSKLQELAQDYEAAASLNYNQMANQQVKVVQAFCEIGSKEAIAQIAQFMVEGNNHEHMDFALPDTLAKYLSQPHIQEHIYNALIIGMLQGQNQTVRSRCIHKLVEARYTPVYRTLLDYRNFLLFDVEHRPQYWSSIFSSIADAVAALNPYVNESIRIPVQRLWLNEPI